MGWRSGVRSLSTATLLLLALGGCSSNNFRTNDVDSAYRSAQGGYSGPQVAVTHDFTIVVPASELEALQQKHREECVKLGCQITHASINRPREGTATARMSLRIEPKAYDAFASSLIAPPAQLTRHAQVAHDLGTPIVDVEKRLAVKNQLRERLTSLLNDQNVKTAADLIAIEKELAQAQSDIENMTAQLDQLHRQTDLVGVDIAYVGAVTRVGLDVTPIYQAMLAIGQTAVLSLSALIYTMAAVAPWTPIIVLVWWFVRRSLRRRRMRSDLATTDAA